MDPIHSLPDLPLTIRRTQPLCPSSRPPRRSATATLSQKASSATRIITAHGYIAHLLLKSEQPSNISQDGIHRQCCCQESVLGFLSGFCSSKCCTSQDDATKREAEAEGEALAARDALAAAIKCLSIFDCLAVSISSHLSVARSQ
jgi:hypothetical protein